MDILDFSITEASTTGVKMPFRHPVTKDPITHKAEGDKEERELHLMLLGPEAPEAARVFAQIQQRSKKQGDDHSPSDEQVEADRIFFAKAIARLVVSGLLFSKGKWIEITAKNAGDYLLAVAPLRQQALDFITNPGNFLAGSQESKAA